MRVRYPWMPPLFAAVACVFAGCASPAARDVQRPAADVRVYGADELAGNQYQVVSHLWADSWRTSFRLPTYPSQDEAIAALRAEAARLGADGLVNVVCLDQRGSPWTQEPAPAFLCYGNAIRIRRG